MIKLSFQMEEKKMFYTYNKRLKQTLWSEERAKLKECRTSSLYRIEIESQPKNWCTMHGKETNNEARKQVFHWIILFKNIQEIRCCLDFYNGLQYV